MGYWKVGLANGHGSWSGDMEGIFCPSSPMHPLPGYLKVSNFLLPFLCAACFWLVTDPKAMQPTSQGLLREQQCNFPFLFPQVIAITM